MGVVTLAWDVGLQRSTRVCGNSTGDDFFIGKYTVRQHVKYYCQTRTNVLWIRNCRTLLYMCLGTLCVHSPDDSTFLREITPYNAKRPGPNTIFLTRLSVGVWLALACVLCGYFIDGSS